MLKFFKNSFIVTILGLILAGFVGWEFYGTTQGIIQSVFLASILSLLEVSISFDNAVVNASVLQKMTPRWQHRFLTWGMLIAVFGMRVIFPLLVVSVATGISPWAALEMAALNPQEYSKHMLEAHIPVSAFGGAFLMMVTLRYFFDTSKDVHWIRRLEQPLTQLGKLEAIEIGSVLVLLLALTPSIPAAEQMAFMVAGLSGLLTYILVDGLGSILQGAGENQEWEGLENAKISTDIAAADGQSDPRALASWEKASAMMFLYLEVLDASFSFDGVIGAFAISNNLFIIAIGLGIGAMFVRSLTILFVEKNTLTEFKYLEHGAFYAIFSLALIMFLNTITPIPEAVTGLVGAAFIGLSLYSSLKEKR